MNLWVTIMYLIVAKAYESKQLSIPKCEELCGYSYSAFQLRQAERLVLHTVKFDIPYNLPFQLCDILLYKCARPQYPIMIETTTSIMLTLWEYCALTPPFLIEAAIPNQPVADVVFGAAIVLATIEFAWQIEVTPAFFQYLCRVTQLSHEADNIAAWKTLLLHVCSKQESTSGLTEQS